MTFSEWTSDTLKRYREENIKTATRESSREFWVGFARRISEHIPPFGEYVFNHNWDALIVLDACRWDALDKVKNEYNWLPDKIPKITSRGTYSQDWMRENFVDKFESKKSETAHVTWNAFSSYELHEEEWNELQEVWRDTWNDEEGLLPPRAITDHAIDCWRNANAERLIVHYMQPHAPFRTIEGIEPLTKDDVGKIDAGRTTVWDLIRKGEVNKEDAWTAYLDNLRWVLNDVEILVNSMDLESVVLTADHGECFGEWGFYGHPNGIPLPKLKRVPWVELAAENKGIYEPDISQWEKFESDQEVEERLEQLGYL